MKKSLFLSLILLPLIFAKAGEPEDNRTGNVETPFVTNDPEMMEDKTPTNANTNTVIVAKSDGSVQCDPDSALSLDQMAEEQLPDIHILSSSKRHDGLARIQVCGAETGMFNTYDILPCDLEKAIEAGFFPLQEDFNFNSLK